jgi:hypothetical protein
MTIRRPLTALLLSTALLLPASGLAQGQAPPKMDATDVALKFMQGRFTMPVTCVMPDGTRVEREEAIVFRPGPERVGLHTLRATLFGIDSGEATHCYNLVNPRVLDRRGTLYVTYRSHGRSDVGMARFRKALADGSLRYHIVDGHLVERPIGSAEGEPRDVQFGDEDRLMSMGPVPRDSTRYKKRRKGRQPRAIEIRFDGPDGYQFVGHYLEDARRWK